MGVGVGTGDGVGMGVGGGVGAGAAWAQPTSTKARTNPNTTTDLSCFDVLISILLGLGILLSLFGYWLRNNAIFHQRFIFFPVKTEKTEEDVFVMLVVNSDSHELTHQVAV